MKTKRVAIVGAGIAGLATAIRLRAQGHQVRVFEASRRAGGRIKTIRRPFIEGQYAEAGARYIRSYHDRTRALAAEFGLELRDVHPPPGRNVIYVHGTLLQAKRGETVDWPDSLELTAREKELGANGIWRAVADQSVPKSDKVWTLEEKRRLDDMTVAELLRERGASVGAVTLQRLGIMQAIGEGVGSYSALSALLLARPHQTRSTSSTIVGGMDKLPRALARSLRGRVEYNEPTVALAQTRDGVRVTRLRRSRRISNMFDRVVCAIPYAQLAAITFDPPMPMSKRESVDALPTTSVCRIFLQFAERFWEDANLSGMAYTDLPMHRCLNATSGQLGCAGILEVYVAGSVARTLTTQSTAARVAFALRYLKECFPDSASEFDRLLVASYSVCWDATKWIGGAYGWFKPGQLLDEVPRAREPFGRIHFAGDHTSAAPGWVQSALESSERVVAEIRRREK